MLLSLYPCEKQSALLSHATEESLWGLQGGRCHICSKKNYSTACFSSDEQSNEDEYVLPRNQIIHVTRTWTGFLNLLGV